MRLHPPDYEAIRQVLAAMAQHVDFGRAEAYAEHFTPEGSFTTVGLAVDPTRVAVNQGREAVSAMVSALYAGTQGHCRHWNGLPVITPAGDHVEVTSYFQVLRIGQVPQAGVILTGVYRDEFVPGEDGEWLVRARLCSCDPQPENGRVSTDPLVVMRDALVGA